MSKVLELKPGGGSDKKRRHVGEIMTMAQEAISEGRPEKIMVILSYEDRPPEMMMAGMGEVEILGTLAFISGLVQTAQTHPIEDSEVPADEPPQEED